MIKLHLVQNNYQQSKQFFEKEKSSLLKLLNGFDIEIKHVGNTAIPKSIGKGIIDMLIICKNESEQISIKSILAESEYRQGELNKKPDGRLFFYRSDSKQFRGGTKAGDIHLHLVIKNDKQGNLRSIEVRDYLLSNPGEVEIYNQEKIRIAKLINNDRNKYCIEKGTYLQNLLDKIKC